MATVGIRRFRSEMRRWLDRASRGEEVVITDRGKAMARLTSADGRDRLDELIAAGLVIPPKLPKTPGKKIRRVRAKSSISDILIRDRR